jgi:biotin transporter BioY
MQAQKFVDLIEALLQQLPSLVTLAACLVFAATRWKRHPKVSLTVMIGLGVLILHGVGFAILYNWLPDFFRGSTDLQTVFFVMGLIYNAALAVPFAVLLAAIFMQRAAAPAASSRVERV